MNARLAIALVVCSLGFAAADAFADPVVGVHAVSAHAPQRAHHNNLNVGAYVQSEHVIGGAYRNSIGRNTAYLAYVQPLGHGFDLQLGGATGYQKRCAERVHTSVRVEVERRDDGSTVTRTYRSHSVERTCLGHSRGAISLAAALSYTSPFAVFGATPRVWLVPGTSKSSTVVHLAAQWRWL